LAGRTTSISKGQIALAIPGEDEDVHIYSSTQHPSEVQLMVVARAGHFASTR
jgi:xanthine dehydrogenase large subunit